MGSVMLRNARILRLIRDPQLLEDLDQEIASRDLRSWDEYVKDLLEDLSVISSQ